MTRRTPADERGPTTGPCPTCGRTGDPPREATLRVCVKLFQLDPPCWRAYFEDPDDHCRRHPVYDGAGWGDTVSDALAFLATAIARDARSCERDSLPCDCRICGEHLSPHDDAVPDRAQRGRMIHSSCLLRDDWARVTCSECGDPIKPEHEWAYDPRDRHRRAHVACVRERGD